MSEREHGLRLDGDSWVITWSGSGLELTSLLFFVTARACMLMLAVLTFFPLPSLFFLTQKIRTKQDFGDVTLQVV